MNYEAWRCTYQSSEQAARAAYEMVVKLVAQRDELVEVAKLVLSAVDNRQDRDFALMNIDLSEAAEIARTAIAKIRAQATTRLQRGKYGKDESKTA